MAAPARDRGGRIWSAAIVAAILGGGGVVTAAVVWRAAGTNTSAPAAASVPSSAARALGRGRATRPESTPPPAPAAAPEPATDPSNGESTPPAPSAIAPSGIRGPVPALPRRRLTAPPPTVVSEPTDEARLLARAFRHLRSEGDAPAALAALDEHDRRFGAGSLASEAALARAEALLLLRRTADALPILMDLRDARAGQTPEIRAVRAELLASTGRCAEASADFDALLAPGSPATTRERALYGRAACALQGESAARAVPDLERYLAEYPRGRFVAAVRGALEKLRRP
jgi:hypothetical protein